MVNEEHYVERGRTWSIDKRQTDDRTYYKVTMKHMT